MSDHFQTTMPRTKIELSPSCGSMIGLNDGRLMLAWGWGTGEVQPIMANYSDDHGRTWTDPVVLKLESGEDLTGVISPQFVRLPSGGLGMALRGEVEKGSAYLDRYETHTFHVSRDEGRTWSDRVEIHPKSVHTHNDSSTVDGLKCLSDGRIVMACDKNLGATQAEERLQVGTLFGESLSGGWTSRISTCFVYWSDDEGQSWHRSRNEVFASIDGGMGGAYPMGEPEVAELDDGRLILMAWTPLGRIFRSYSTDRGESWHDADPTDLAVRIGGCFSLKRIPGSSDLLVIWCQLSRFEAMQGLYRHRLSCAVSKDAGQSWQHHKNLVSLDDTTRIDPGPMVQWLSGRPCQPLDRDRYHRAPGPLRNDHVYCTFQDGEAVIVHGQGVLGNRSVIEKTYGMQWDDLAEKFGFEPRPGRPMSVLGNNRVHVVPIDWFYS